MDEPRYDYEFPQKTEHVARGPEELPKPVNDRIAALAQELEAKLKASIEPAPVEDQEENLDYASNPAKVFADMHAKVTGTELPDDIKAQLHAEVDAMEKEFNEITEGSKDPETIKLRIREAAPRRHFSTNVVPIGVKFRMAKSGTMYVRIAEKSEKPGAGSLRRVNADGAIISRNRRVRSNTAKSLEGQLIRRARLSRRPLRVKVTV